jgi:hypothetical protein
MAARYLTALLLTLAIELPLVLWWLRSAPRKRVLAAALLSNLLTHLSIHFGLAWFSLGQAAFVVVAESWAFSCEAFLYWLAIRPASLWKAVAASALANGVSYAMGLLLFG